MIPIEDSDYIVVPPLQGFVMNRVQGDNFENLLYKVFVSINEHTNIAELATVLQTSLQEVKVCVCVVCVCVCVCVRVCVHIVFYLQH